MSVVDQSEREAPSLAEKSCRVSRNVFETAIWRAGTIFDLSIATTQAVIGTSVQTTSAALQTTARVLSSAVGTVVGVTTTVVQATIVAASWITQILARATQSVCGAAVLATTTGIHATIAAVTFLTAMVAATSRTAAGTVVRGAMAGGRAVAAAAVWLMQLLVRASAAALGVVVERVRAILAATITIGTSVATTAAGTATSTARTGTKAAGTLAKTTVHGIVTYASTVVTSAWVVVRTAAKVVWWGVAISGGAARSFVGRKIEAVESGAIAASAGARTGVGGAARCRKGIVMAVVTFPGTLVAAVTRKPNRAETSALVPHLSPETFRQIYVALDLPPSRDPVIGITSAIGGEGRTTVALGLAQTLASDLDTKVLLVEVDLERPCLAERLQIPSSPGLAHVLRGEKRLADVTHPVSHNLMAVTAGTTDRDAGLLLRRLPACDPFRTNRQDLPAIVILDLPPILSHSYSPLASAAANAVVLVVRAGATPAAMVREAVARMDDRPPAGVVFNAARSSIPARWLRHGP